MVLAAFSKISQNLSKLHHMLQKLHRQLCCIKIKAQNNTGARNTPRECSKVDVKVSGEGRRGDCHMIIHSPEETHLMPCGHARRLNVWVDDLNCAHALLWRQNALDSPATYILLMHNRSSKLVPARPENAAARESTDAKRTHARGRFACSAI